MAAYNDKPDHVDFEEKYGVCCLVCHRCGGWEVLGDIQIDAAVKHANINHRACQVSADLDEDYRPVDPEYLLGAEPGRLDRAKEGI